LHPHGFFCFFFGNRPDNPRDWLTDNTITVI